MSFQSFIENAIKNLQGVDNGEMISRKELNLRLRPFAIELAKKVTHHEVYKTEKSRLKAIDEFFDPKDRNSSTPGIIFGDNIPQKQILQGFDCALIHLKYGVSKDQYDKTQKKLEELRQMPGTRKEKRANARKIQKMEKYIQKKDEWMANADKLCASFFQEWWENLKIGNNTNEAKEDQKEDQKEDKKKEQKEVQKEEEKKEVSVYDLIEEVEMEPIYPFEEDSYT